jgi:hypothetical protein
MYVQEERMARVRAAGVYPLYRAIAGLVEVIEGAEYTAETGH